MKEMHKGKAHHKKAAHHMEKASKHHEMEKN